MIASSTKWEEQLLRKALIPAENGSAFPKTPSDRRALAKAYQICSEITRVQSQTFYLSSGLLRGAARDAARALYAFCRVSDDLVDTPDPDTAEKFTSWRRINLDPNPRLDDPVALAWTHTRAQYAIPGKYAEQLLDGVSMDIKQKRYANFGDLAHYCYGVASTVGLMSMHIIGYESIDAIPYAIKLGVALQLTNILRDVGEDWQMGRLYLPKDELEAFGIRESDIAAGRVDGRWQRFMQFQIARTRRLYAESLPGIKLLSRRGRFAIAASAILYQAILEDIERNNYDVFTRRAFINTQEKVTRLPGIWWKANRISPGNKVAKSLQIETWQ